MSKATVWQVGKRRMAMLAAPGDEDAGRPASLTLKSVVSGVPGSAQAETWTLVGSMDAEEFDRA